MSTRKFVEEGQEDRDRARAAMAAFYRELRESQDNRCAVCRDPLGDENHQYMHFDENDGNPRLLCPICSATDPVAVALAEGDWREVPEPLAPTRPLNLSDDDKLRLKLQMRRGEGEDDL
jgi:hypothetical protein